MMKNISKMINYSAWEEILEAHCNDLTQIKIESM
jgi:hypothetical protein